MSRRGKPPAADPCRAHAPLFAALGDGTRLELLGRLAGGRPHSISELAAESALTRQAITKHLRVLQQVGLVNGERRGREVRFTFVPERVAAARAYLEQVAAQWDRTLGQLKTFVESAER